jgi:hypothetical protein
MMAPQKHKVIPPSHLIPSRPREAEGESSEDRDWGSQASPILRKTLYLARGVLFPTLSARRGIARDS